MGGHRDDSDNCISSYRPLSPTVFQSIIAILKYIVDENREVSIPDYLVPNYSHFATTWQYEWATVEEYITRLREWIACGPESYVAALVLQKRLECLGAVPPTTKRTVHRLFLACLVVAVKTIEDETLCNVDFAKVGCVTVTELNHMERFILKALSFKCIISADEFQEMHQIVLDVDALCKKRAVTETRSGRTVESITALSSDVRPRGVYAFAGKKYRNAHSIRSYVFRNSLIKRNSKRNSGPAVDHGGGWSDVPTAAQIAADALKREKIANTTIDKADLTKPVSAENLKPANKSNKSYKSLFQRLSLKSGRPKKHVEDSAMNEVGQFAVANIIIPQPGHAPQPALYLRQDS